MPTADAFRFDSFPQSIETPRLRLRRPLPSDEGRLARMFFSSRGENADPVTLEFSHRFAEFAIEHWARYGFGFFTIDLVSDTAGSELSGHAGLKYRDCGPGVWGETSAAIEVGYALAPVAQGRGYATEAARAVIAAAFEVSTIPSLLGRCNTANARSAATLLRCGMTEIEPAGPSRLFEIHRPSA